MTQQHQVQQQQQQQQQRAPGTVVDVSDDEFAREVLGRAGLTLVEFGGKWCPPCRAMEPLLAQLASQRADIAVRTVDVDDSPASAARFDVRSLPTLILFRDGVAVAQRIGMQRMDALLAMVVSAAR